MKPVADYDLAIVGASFAGLTAARSAALRGLKVLVIEAKKDPGARIHTTGIVVREAAEAVDIPHTVTRRVHGIRLYAPSLKHMDLFAPGYAFLTTDTAALMRWLAEEATRAGVKILCDTRFTAARYDSGLVHLDTPAITARFLLGCDGARSQVAEAFGLGKNSRFLIGVEAEYSGLDSFDPRFLHCFLDSSIAPGYIAWAAPGPKVTQIGLATKSDAKPALQRFIEQTEDRFHYSAASIVERRSGVIPCGGLVRPYASDGVMLMGDAAGLVSPLTAGGIKLSFEFGRRSAHAIADHLLNAGPPPEKIIDRDLPRFRIKSALRSALSYGPPNWMYDLLIGTPPLRALAQRLYFHRKGGGGSFEEFAGRVAD
uniref:NAD(P)/FAD-dependent oxidoreductase n=1 Tax=Pararhizobium sp. IMCC3301 TaxID=3067904 RepID=UPI002740E926|nr:NAD(P)/FAD-dependent oxidoreductase [Pararhizobium sp. IMCC3301]